MKTTLSGQFYEMRRQATLIIKEAAVAAGGTLVVSVKDMEGDEVSELFKDSTIQVYENGTYADNTEFYLLNIIAGEHDCTLTFLDEQGDEEQFEVDVLSADSMFEIADFLSNSILPKPINKDEKDI